MDMTRTFRVYASIAGVLAASLTLGGCLGSPTYGTDKTAGEQLLDDLGGAMAIGQIGQQNTSNIKYQPRPGLVVRKDDQLIQPQQSLASKDNPNWVESPEDTRTRLRAEATENADNVNYRSPLLGAREKTQRGAIPGSTNTIQKAQIEQYRAGRRLQQGLYSDKRRYLSDPPLEYRKLPEEAKADLGEPEKKKETRRKKEAEIAKTGQRSWWPF